jgi:TRAP-type C4-dicarboxylate transport system permease small subunit
MKILWNLFDRLVDLSGFIACMMIVLLTFGVAGDVLLRAASLGSMPWALEITEYMLYLVTFFGAPWVLRANGHVNVDVLLRVVPKSVTRILELVADVFGIVVSLYLTVYGWKVLSQAFAINMMIYKTLQFPEWYILWPLPFCAALLAIEFVRRLIKGWHGEIAETTGYVG